MALWVLQAGEKENSKKIFFLQIISFLVAKSIVFGAVGAITCNMALNLKHLLHFDDALDVFAVHGMGGIVGNVLTGIFAQKRYAHEIDGGWLDRNWMQIVYQIVDTVAGLIWSFAMTFVILWIMNKIPGLSLRVDIETERAGLDQGELGFNISEQEKSDRLRKKSVKGFNEPLGAQAFIRSSGLHRHKEAERSEQFNDDRRRKKSVKGFNEPLGTQTELQTGGLDHRELGDLGTTMNGESGEKRRKNGHSIGHSNVAFHIDQEQDEDEQSRM